MQADGDDIELIEVRERRAAVRVSGKCAGCPSSHVTLHLGIEMAIRDEVPEFAGLSVVLPEVTAAAKPPERFLDADHDRPKSARPERLSAETVVVGGSARMREVIDFVKVVANSESSVLITGESGTGKELIANLIHRSSARRNRPFVPVSCAILAETLIESELFGHERGAFTNAFRERPGRFELAEGGTLFLDDIDDVPLAMQVKLLRVLQTRTVERVGGVRGIPIDVRVLTGSKRDLRKLVAAGTFREDLFYRLNVIPIQLPPLRERVEDIPLLVDHFLKRYFSARGKEPRPLSQAMLGAFVRYPWPGNVRELENACERIAQTCICDSVVAGCVPAGILFHQPPSGATAETDADATIGASVALPMLDPSPLDQRLARLESQLIANALRAAGGNKSRAAAMLKIKRSTLGDRIRKLDLGHLESRPAGTSRSE
jgi:DNA-binding NtrC family response regulator